MNSYQLTKLRAQRAILEEIAVEYSGRTLENIIDNLDQRIKFYETHPHAETPETTAPKG
jgi:hypothetical protein